MNKVFIARFGFQNYEWPVCLERSSIAAMVDMGSFPFYQQKNKPAFIEWEMQYGKTPQGTPPVHRVASRWYGALEDVEHTSGDMWLHRAQDFLYWTISRSDEPEWVPQNDRHVYVCHKPCEPWSHKDRKGNPLRWNNLHAKAKDFLFTQGTRHALTPDNAEYAHALINGYDLAAWHNRSEWKVKAGAAGSSLDARKKAIIRMVMTVKETVRNANGQTVERTVKNKEIRFSDTELKAHIEKLLAAQDGLCAITGIPLQYDSNVDDSEMLCSLDRIDSNGHYETGNLQVVCNFINRWKNDGDDGNFRRLISILRSPVPPHPNHLGA
jgi:hypothetical protein